MNGKCFEAGVLQAFLDGETSPEMSLEVADHTADCDACAQMLAAADEESSFVFAALDREMNSLVPTQRLWSRINDSIAVEKRRAPLWNRMIAYLTVQLGNSSFAAAAGIVIVLGMFAILWTPQTDNSVSPVASIQTSSQRPDIAEVNISSSDPVTSGVVAASQPEAAVPPAGYKVTKTNLPDAKLKALVTNANDRRPQERPRAEHAVVREADVYLPGEESYVKTIAELRQSVDGQKDAVFTPATRVSFERDMAVVDDSIRKMRAVVRENPRNQSAKQILYSSYQDKIDLLSSVAQREELMASIR